MRSGAGVEAPRLSLGLPEGGLCRRDGNLVAIEYPNGVVQQQTFDPGDQMTATAATDPL